LFLCFCVFFFFFFQNLVSLHSDRIRSLLRSLYSVVALDDGPIFNWKRALTTLRWMNS